MYDAPRRLALGQDPGAPDPLTGLVELAIVPGWMWWAVGTGVLFLLMRTTRPKRRRRSLGVRHPFRSPFVLS